MFCLECYHTSKIEPITTLLIQLKISTLVGIIIVGIILMPSKTFDSQVVECPEILKVEILNKSVNSCFIIFYFVIIKIYTTY